MAKKFYWLKMDKDYLSSPKIKKLRKIAGGDTYTIIYLKMQLFSIENGGVIEYQGIEPTLEEELALILDEDEDNVKITISFLFAQGLLICGDKNTFLLPDAANRIGTESESRERVRAYRERKAIRESIQLEMVQKLSHEQILLPDGNVKFIDNKRYGGNAEYVYELAECKCEICGESDTKKLVIHHNNGYSNDLNDLYLLCHSCHKKVESGKLKCESHRRKGVTCNTYVTGCNSEKEKEKDIDSDQDGEGEIDAPAPAGAESENRKKHGEYGWVLLTDEEYDSLVSTHGRDEVHRAIRYIDESAQSTKNKNGWSDWFAVLKRCIRDGWGKSTTKATQAAQQNYQPTQKRVQDQKDWLDEFLKSQEGIE